MAEEDRVLLEPTRRLQFTEVEITLEEVSKNWRVKSTFKYKHSVVIEYYCAFGKVCPAKLKKKTIANGVYSFSSNKVPHKNHRQLGLTDEQKDIVSDCLLSGVTTPNNILLTFRSKNKTEPEKGKLANYLLNNRKKLLENHVTSDLGDVITWAKKHIDIPSLDTPFCVNYDVGDAANENCHMRVFISTPRLLRTALGFQHIHADATYKLVHQGYPILVTGITDRARKFHPAGIVVCKAENSADYQFLFSSLKKGVEAVTKKEYKPKYLIADCADAITNGFVEVFGSDIIRVFCYYHVIAAIDKRLHSVNKDTRRAMRLDITYLRQATSVEIFETASQLFVDKYEEVEPSFTSYFQQQWMVKKPQWYLGCVETGIPTTNNALESTNRYIKDTFMKRKKIVFGEFLQMASHILSSWSVDRNGSSPNNIDIQYRLIPDISVMKATDAWLKTKPEIAYSRQGDQQIAYVGFKLSAAKKKKLSDANRHIKWKNFDSYIQHEIDVHRIFFKDTDFIPDYKCTCVDFLKLYLCKHVLGIATILDKYALPPEAMTGGLDYKKKRGRPKRMNKALAKE